MYDGRAAVEYARRWLYERNGRYPRFGNDCTNFLSQAMEAGGMQFTRTGGRQNPTPSSADKSEYDLKRSRLYEEGIGRHIEGRENLRLGDVVYYKLQGVDKPWSHAGMVTRITKRGVWIGQHTVDKEEPFVDVARRLNRDLGPGKWAYDFVRPVHAQYNIG